jgi:hypothetical protein
VNRSTLVAIVAASALLAPAVVEAAGPTQRMKPVVVAEAAIPAAVAAESTAGAANGCTRRVRIVYAAAYQMPAADCAGTNSTK